MYLLQAYPHTCPFSSQAWDIVDDDNYYHGNRQHKLKDTEEQKPHRTKNPDRHYKNPRIDTGKSEEEKSRNT
jgi:hypothetical protein